MPKKEPPKIIDVDVPPLTTRTPVALMEEEVHALYNLHAARAQYFKDCAEVNRRIAGQPEKHTGTFAGEPLQGEPANEKNWLERATIFEERAKKSLARAHQWWPPPELL